MKSILKIFELKLTRRQLAQVDKEYIPGNYSVAFQPQSSNALDPGVLKVVIVSRSFGDRLRRQVFRGRVRKQLQSAVERQRDEKRV